MKNIHLIKTDKPSRLYLQSNNELQLRTNIIRTSEDYLGTNQNIYITNSEKPKARDWVLGDFPDNPIGKVISKYGQEFTAQSLNGDKYGLAEYDSNKIILTTDPDLIQGGIQPISDEFLQWFVENPSCERVEVSYGLLKPFQSNYVGYIIHLPDTTDVLEEPKQTDENGKPITYWGGLEEPKQYPIGGYAPGFYSCTCVTCKEEFQGHKRATQCEHCAIKMTQEEPKNTCPKCRTKDFDNCHSIKCPMRKEEPTLDQIYEKALEMESRKQQKYDEMLAMLEELVTLHQLGLRHEIGQYDEIKQLIKEAKEL